MKKTGIQFVRTSSCAALFVCALPSHAAEFFVSPSGSDANSGTKEKPFASLERARDAASGGTVWIRGGDYFLTNALELASQDSGTIFRGADGERPRLIAAKKISAAEFHPVKNAATLARIPAELRGRMLELDLVANGIEHRKPSPDLFNDNGGIVELYFNGKRMPLARFPNGEECMTIKRVLDNAGVFEFRDEFAAEHAAWAKQVDRGVWLKGYWRCMWENSAVRVKSFDLSQHTVTMAKPAPGGYGSKYTRPQGNGKERYWMMNLLEAIDLPGEWCEDFSDAKIYFLPPGKLDAAEILIADRDAPLIHIRDATNIVIRGLTLEGGLGHGVVIEGGCSNLIAGCTVKNMARYGVRVDGGFEHTVQSCDIFDVGAGGVWLGGGDEKSSPRIACGHRVVNNHIHHFARIERVYAPGINAGFTGGGGGGHHVCVGAYIAHNMIHDTPHGGVLFGSWDSVFEFNEVYRYCLFSDDLGAFYSYDRFVQMGNHTFRYNLVHSTSAGDGFYFDCDHRDEHLYGNIVRLDSRPGGRGTAFLYKIGTQPDHPQLLDCHDNIAINCNDGFQFVTGPGSAISNNAAINCAVPYKWQTVKGAKIVNATDALASGPNAAFATGSSFPRAANFDFSIAPDSPLLKTLPTFAKIPLEKIGLHADEYRTQLPGENETLRHAGTAGDAGPGYGTLDRKN